MNDMSSVIVAKSDQINADDLISGPRTICIKSVSINSGTEQPVSISIEGETKVWRPCKTASRVLVAAWGADAKQYVGKSVTIYRDPNVKWGGLAVGGIRVSHMSDIDPKKISDGKMTIILKESRNHSKPAVIKLLTNTSPATTTDPATKWANSYIADLAKVFVADALESFVLRKAAKLEELCAARPDLHSQVELALSKRRTELGGSTNTSTDEDVSFQPEGPAETQQGEIVTLESALDEINSAELISDINNRMAGLLPLLPEADGDQVRTRAMERISEMGG